MSAEGRRRRRTRHLYEIVVVPVGENRRTRRFRASRLTLGMLGALVFFLCVGVTLAFLVYTPVAMYVPIPNPGLEEKYGKQILETQERLKDLADDVLVLQTYNRQLRKALGEGLELDSTKAGGRGSSEPQESRVEMSNLAENTVRENTQGETAGDMDVTPSTYNVVVAEGVHSGFPLLLPVEGFLSQGFDPVRRHYGVDIAAKQGTPVYAAADGIVVFANWTYEDGNMLILSHGGGYLTVYKHNQILLKSVHAVAKRGEVIALLGTSGNTSLGPHLHFEVMMNGIPQDPESFLLTSSRIQ